MKPLLETANHLLVGGHRGCACDAPENSIAAMQEGLSRGADYLEIDIQLTKDEVPVVIHDVRLEKQTCLVGYVHEYMYAELKAAIPSLCTLQEAMAWGHTQNAFFGLELKTVPLDMQPQTLRLVALACDILSQENMMQHVFLFGQDYQVLRHLRRCCPQVAIGLIVPFVPADPVALMREMDACIYLSYIYNMTPEMIAQLHAAGYYISGAILRDEKWVNKAVRLGVDMFESDHPEVYHFTH